MVQGIIRAVEFNTIELFITIDIGGEAVNAQ